MCGSPSVQGQPRVCDRDRDPVQRKSNLREEEFASAHRLMGHSPLWWEDTGAGSSVQWEHAAESLHTPAHLWNGKQKREACTWLAFFCFLLINFGDSSSSHIHSSSFSPR